MIDRKHSREKEAEKWNSSSRPKNHRGKGKKTAQSIQTYKTQMKKVFNRRLGRQNDARIQLPPGSHQEMKTLQN